MNYNIYFAANPVVVNPLIGGDWDWSDARKMYL